MQNLEMGELSPQFLIADLPKMKPRTIYEMFAQNHIPVPAHCLQDELLYPMSSSNDYRVCVTTIYNDLE